ncbi:hypothetical protein GCM10009087_25510 [Sphingomonas oligophenolica]
MKAIGRVPIEPLPGTALVVQAQIEQRERGFVDPVQVEWHGGIGTEVGGYVNRALSLGVIARGTVIARALCPLRYGPGNFRPSTIR